MKRREFLTTSGIASAGLIAVDQPLPKLKKPNSRNYKMGYQLYSIRDKMNDNPVDILSKLKKIGYTHFEMYGYSYELNQIYGYTPQELYNRTQELDIAITSGHYNFSNYFFSSESELKKVVDSYIACAQALNSDFIVWPTIDPALRTMESYRRMVDKLNIIGQHCQGSGIAFAYHNNGFEFENHEGQTGYDLIVKGTDPELVKLQMDMYWVMHSSQNATPKRLVKEHSGRIVMWHIKDMDCITRDYTELGNGSINYENVMPDPVESGLVHYYIEQGGNFATDSMSSAEVSGNYFKKRLHI